MSRQTILVGLISVIAVLCTFSHLHAQWVENGLQICALPSEQYIVRTVTDGEGGAIVVWRDYRNGNFDIYAQRLDEHGVPLWTADGVAVCTEINSQPEHEVTADGEGGAIITWRDNRNGNSDIYAQRIDSDGMPLWTVNGVAVCTQTAGQLYPVLASDDAGGAIITWADFRPVTYANIYAQRINSVGSPLWTANGVQVCSDPNSQTSPVITEDGSGGAYIAWLDSRNGNDDIYLQHVNSSGGFYYGGIGKSLCSAANGQYNPAIISDGLGGVFATWQDYRSGTSQDIYATRVNCGGLVIGPADGFAICTSTGQQIDPVLTTDGLYGAIIAWRDSRSADIDIYAQRIDFSGSVLWTGNGVGVCTGLSDQYTPEIVSDGVGGAIIAWMDTRYLSGYEIFAQRLNANGNAVWTTNGAAVSVATSEQQSHSITTDGNNGAIIAFLDYRNGQTDITVQRMERNGYWGYPAPVISSVRDIPGDEGGFVNLSWDASRLDVYPEDKITQYTVWRAIDEAAAMAMLEDGARLADETFELMRNDLLTSISQDGSVPLPVDGSPIIRRGVLGSEPYYWIQIATVSASDYIDTYAFEAATLFDSTATSTEYHYFQVIAHESDPTGFWVSAVDSGYSVDNLAPCPPAMLAGAQEHLPEGLRLTWDPNIEIDLDNYTIYRGTDENFFPGPGNLLAAPCDTFYFDGGWTWDSGYCYKVAAVDVHGNESKYSLLCSDNITGDETPATPLATYLEQNYPNPFNPSTRITFGLQAPGNVSLRIYDAAGRLVRVLVNERREAGTYSETWNGLDDSGRAVASGVYFYGLMAGDFKETKKMVLLR
jgi:hypothetical protein